MHEQSKIEILEDLLGSLESVVVAFSGGVDSTFLLAKTIQVLGKEKVLAVTADSPSLPRSEFKEVRMLAEKLEARHEIIKTNELEDYRYSCNDSDRCYYCKGELFSRLKEIREKAGFKHVLFGGVTDDLGDYRPGMRAAEEAGALAPLLKAGLTKADIRILSKKLGLPTWDKPGSPCLASRVPYGSPIDAHVLKQIEDAEHFLCDELDLKDIRVRHHGSIARIEIAPEDFERFLSIRTREKISRYIKSLGFSFVSLDLEGFRSGRMNEVLFDPQGNP